MEKWSHHFGQKVYLRNYQASLLSSNNVKYRSLDGGVVPRTELVFSLFIAMLIRSRGTVVVLGSVVPSMTFSQFL